MGSVAYRFRPEGGEVLEELSAEDGPNLLKMRRAGHRCWLDDLRYALGLWLHMARPPADIPCTLYEWAA